MPETSATATPQPAATPLAATTPLAGTPPTLFRPPAWTVWPAPKTPATHPMVIGSLAVGVAGAVAIPWTTPGVGWLAFGAATALALIPAVRRRPAEPRRQAIERAAWGFAALLLLAVPAVRAAEWLTVFCVLTAAGCATIAIDGARTVRGFVLGTAALPVAALRALPWVGRLAQRTGALRRPGRLVVPIAVSFILLLVFGSLFAGADPVFAHLVAVSLPTVDGGVVTRWIFSIALLGPAALGASYLLIAPARLDRASEPARTWRRIEWGLPVGTLVLVFALFVGVQATVLFGGADHVLQTEQLTFAEYARTGFWELLTVTVLTLLIMAVVARRASRTDRADRGWLRGLLGGLAGLSLVIVASALGRMWTYEEAYGFSRLRVLVSACELWLGLVFVLILVAGVRLDRSARWLPRTVIATGVLALIVLAALNPDRFIADHNIDRFERTGRLDQSYLTTLSIDALPAIDRLADPQRSCLLWWVNAHAEPTTNGIWGWTLSRQQADTLLASRAVSPVC